MADDEDDMLEIVPSTVAIKPYHPLWDKVDLNELTDQEWKAIYLITENYTAREAARIMGIKPSTFRTHKENAIRKLKEQSRRFAPYR